MANRCEGTVPDLRTEQSEVVESGLSQGMKMVAKLLVLGIGNTIRCDDGAAIEVVRRLREKTGSEDFDIKETSEAGLNLLDLMAGYEKVIIVDSIQTEGGTAGNIYRFTQNELKQPRDFQISHNTGINSILKLAKEMRLLLTEDITFYAVEIEKADSFGEGLTIKVERAIPSAVELIEREINKTVRHCESHSQEVSLRGA